MGIVADVQAYLATEGVVDGATDWPSVRRRANDVMGDQQVIFTEDGGADPETPAPIATLGDAAMAEPAVQIRVRGEPWDGDGALYKAVEIYDALHGLLRTEVGYTYYIRIKAQTPEPVFIGFDEQGRPEFTISFRALRAVVSPS